MPTFLPFPRAVKTPAARHLVCALIFGLGANCVPKGTPNSSPLPGPPTGPLPAAVDSGTLKPPTSVGPPTSDAQALLAEAGAPPAPAPLVSVDLPYPALARPRAPDPAQAAAEDEELARWDLGGSSDPNSISSQGSYHPGTRVVVDTRPAKRRAGAPALPPPRGLSHDRVQAQTRSRGYWPFRLCFELGQREKKGSGGETRVAFTIGTRGKVSAARLLDSKLENATSAACLVRELHKLEFTPAPASKLRMVASIKIYPGDAELPLIPDAAVVAALPAGEFDPEATRARLTTKQGELDACFAEARRTDPALWGRLALSVILEMDGSVHRVTEVESHFQNPGATRCAQILVSSLVFPSVNGKPFSFVIPLRLGPNPAQKKTGSDESPSPSQDGGASGGASSD
jgi:hypothetical protein